MHEVCGGPEASPYGLGLGQEQGYPGSLPPCPAPSLSSLGMGAQLLFLTVLKPLGREASAMNTQWRGAALWEEWEEMEDNGPVVRG